MCFDSKDSGIARVSSEKLSYKYTFGNLCDNNNDDDDDDNNNNICDKNGV